MIPDYSQIRPEIKSKIRQYADEHLPTGDFLRAVFENKLKEAFMRADDDNCENLFHIVAYCYEHIPAASWGSEAKVKAWIGEDGHVLRVHSLHDARASCSCGGWSLLMAGSATREHVEAQFKLHKERFD